MSVVTQTPSEHPRPSVNPNKNLVAVVQELGPMSDGPVAPVKLVPPLVPVRPGALTIPTAAPVPTPAPGGARLGSEDEVLCVR